METINYFTENLPARQAEIVRSVHLWLTAYPGLECKMRYRIPFFFRKSWICYTNPKKSGGVELAFIRANEFRDPSGLLDFKGRKMVAGITLEDPAGIPFDQLDATLQEALLLDETQAYKGPKKS